MPWSSVVPNTGNNEHCVLVWHSSTDGVTKYSCNERLPAICATKRY